MNKKTLIIIIIILILGVFVSMKWKDIYYEGVSWVAVFRQNLSICDKIQDQKWKDICYRNVAARGGQFQTIKQIKEKYESELMAIEGVVGVGIGKCDDKFCIKVYLENDSPDLKARIPIELDGFKIHIEVTGPIEALPK